MSAAWNNFKRSAGRFGGTAKTTRITLHGESVYCRSGVEAELGMWLANEYANDKTIRIVHERAVALLPTVKHRVDFSVVRIDPETKVEIGTIEAHEAKGGHEDGQWVVKQNVWRALAPFPMNVWKKIRGRINITERIEPWRASGHCPVCGVATTT